MPDTPTPVHDRVATALQKTAQAHAAIHSAISTQASRHARQRAVRLEKQRLDNEVAHGGHT